jgi:hypothetical protein
MENEIDYEEVLEKCNEAIDLCDELLGGSISPAGEEYVENVQEHLTDMHQWIDEHQRCTPKQLIAIENMIEGLNKWSKE